MLDPKLLAPETVRPLRVAEYERLIEAGAFHDERIELLAGVLVQMSPQGQRHLVATSRIARALNRLLDGRRVEVLSHSPVQVSDDSMPEPDVSVVKDLDWVKRARPPLLVVEVSDSSLEKDLEVFTRPSGATYQMHHVVTRAGVLRPVRLRGVAIAVADILPPARKRKANAKARRGR